MGGVRYGKRSVSTERAIALALLTQGADRLTAPEIQRYAELLGVSTRQIYRYLDKIGKAKFLLKA